MSSSIGAVYPTESEGIKQYLHCLWKKEYPAQCFSTVLCCDWEYRLVPLSTLQANSPRSAKKAKRYLSLLQEGMVVFPPLVCINGEVVDGLHRYWAYHEARFEMVRIYQNIPLM